MRAQGDAEGSTAVLALRHRPRKMLRLTHIVPVWIIAAALGTQAPIQAQAGQAPLPVSLARIRAALEQPPPMLAVPAASAETPTFRVEVRQPFSMLRSVEDEPFDPTWGLPSAGELLMGGVGKIRSAAVGYKHRRAKRRARREVDDALAAFCAAHGCPAPAPRQP